MLVLGRHKDESIIIGNEVVITVVDIRRDKVRLGIDAPKEVPVHRREVYDAIKRDNQVSILEKEYRIFQESLNSENFGTALEIICRNQENFGKNRELDKITYEQIDCMAEGLKY